MSNYCLYRIDVYKTIIYNKLRVFIACGKGDYNRQFIDSFVFVCRFVRDAKSQDPIPVGYRSEETDSEL